MKLRHLLLIAGLATLGLAPTAAAQTESFLVYVEPSLKARYSLSPSDHLLMFTMPVQIPGANLPPGAYIFRFITPSTLQVLSATNPKVYAVFFTIRAEGYGDEHRERIRFDLAGGDNPPRMVGWYLPGSVGYEFLYPKPKRIPMQEAIER